MLSLISFSFIVVIKVMTCHLAFFSINSECQLSRLNCEGTAHVWLAETSFVYSIVMGCDATSTKPNSYFSL